MSEADKFHTQMNLAFNLSRFARTHKAILRLQAKFHYYRHKYEQAKARESKQSEPQGDADK